ncbi:MULTISPECIES: TlpA family protein disulfide reductase [unclassified Carboxylicivirga]|uniref:TlpA family protein disulfide reductase n=1 Tax=Carboxylicivirga TaxID=1628153 RepID=UPI003D331D58
MDEEEMGSTSVTGKELLWSKWQVKWPDSTGRVQFKANIEEADLLLIKSNNSYKTFRCYLEPGQTLNVIYKTHQYTIIGNSIAARQNMLLQKVDQQMTLLSSQKELEKWPNYQILEQLVSKFSNDNPDASTVFLRFIRFNIQYFLYTELLGEKSVKSSIYRDFNGDELNILNNVIKDSNYELAYLSPYYRQLLKIYIDYYRVRLFVDKIKPDDNPILNELALSSLLSSKQLSEYQMAMSLKAIFHVGCNLNFEYAINQYTGYWKLFLLSEYKETCNRIPSGLNLEDNHKQITISKNSLLNIPIEMESYRGTWVYLEITKGSLGYSPFETYYLKRVKERVNNLDYMFISLADKKVSGRDTLAFPKVVWASEENLRRQLKSEVLPYSLLVNPAGEVVRINLPRASTGMLEPMLRAIIQQEK